MQATLLGPVAAPSRKRTPQPVADTPATAVRFTTRDLFKAAGVITGLVSLGVSLVIFVAVQIMGPMVENRATEAGAAAATTEVDRRLPEIELQATRIADERVRAAVANMRREADIRHSALLDAIRQLKEK